MRPTPTDSDWGDEALPPNSQVARISSKLTWLNKRAFPFVWFGGLALFLLGDIPTALARKSPDAAIFLIMPLFMAVVSYFLCKSLLWDLMDEVWDGGDCVVVCNGGKKVVVPLANCINVNYSQWVNPQRITLTLREPCEFGREIAFMPPQRMFPWGTPQIVRDLIERVDAARRQ